MDAEKCINLNMNSNTKKVLFASKGQYFPEYKTTNIWLHNQITWQLLYIRNLKILFQKRNGILKH